MTLKEKAFENIVVKGKNYVFYSINKKCFRKHFFIYICLEFGHVQKSVVW